MMIGRCEHHENIKGIRAALAQNWDWHLFSSGCNFKPWAAPRHRCGSPTFTVQWALRPHWLDPGGTGLLLVGSTAHACPLNQCMWHWALLCSHLPGKWLMLPPSPHPHLGDDDELTPPLCVIILTRWRLLPRHEARPRPRPRQQCWL